jgi:peptidoglycan/LPS O-acetylase OafA/YrhL
MASRAQVLAADHQAFRSTTRFAGLDGVRALAALAVIFFHFGGSRWDLLQGWIGVHVFFTLSGFLITTLLVRERRRTGRIGLRAFALRRAYRIVPLYVLVLAVTVVASLLLGGYVSSGLAAGLPYYLTFSGELYDHGSPFGIAWSLGVEEKFYIVLPLLLAAAGFLVRRSRTGRRAVAALAAVLAATGATVLIGSAVDRLQLGSVTYAYVSILMGVALALALDHPRGFAVLRPLRHPVIGLAAAAAFVALQLNVRTIGTGRGPHWQTVVPLYAMAVALLLVAVTAPGPVQRLLSWRALRFVGQRSYALYLTQSLVGALVSVVLHGGSTLKATSVAVVGLGLAHILQRTVEAPCIAAGRRRIQRPTRGSSSASDRGAAERTAEPGPARSASRPRSVASPATPG